MVTDCHLAHGRAVNRGDNDEVVLTSDDENGGCECHLTHPIRSDDVMSEDESVSDKLSEGDDSASNIARLAMHSCTSLSDPSPTPDAHHHQYRWQ